QGTDPLLSGGSGQVWVSNDGQFRLELYGDNGDPEVVVTKTGWWVSDPMMQTVYEGSLPQGGGASDKSGRAHALPTVARIQSDLGKLMQHMNVSGAAPTDVGGQPTYTVTVSPKHSGGLLGEAQLAWDAIKGVPLRFAVYARGDNSNPVVEIAATGVSYGPIGSSIFDIAPPAGYKVVKVAAPASSAVQKGAAKLRHGKQAEVTGLKAVASKVSFKLLAPAKLVGLPRQSASLLETGGHNGALVTYGQGLGGIAVIEQPATASSSQKLNLPGGNGDHAGGVTLPGVSIDGATGQELDTALGTIVRFTRGGVSFTVLGSVAPFAADAAARGL
ncbi:MAG: LolA family protein, partial [Solirubrobacteraceae bacterium]